MINGDTISSKISEIGLEEIKYKNSNNLEGPNYVISKEDVSKIVFNNGSEEVINKPKQESIEETKSLIIETINKYAYNKEGIYVYKLSAKFDQKYLDISFAPRKKPEKYVWNKFYDFSDNCNFHNLSYRNSGISYINVEVYRAHRKNNGEFKKRYKEKLVILIEKEGQEKILRDALIRFNEYYQEDK
tara:strand:- start:392 stop:952 length:561 start_codon:yes stop_codon:yes gene_type:complete